MLFIVALLTLTLAVLAGYLFFVAGSPKPASSVEAAAVPPKTVSAVPTDEELEKKTLFEGKKFFNLKNDNDQKIAVIQINMELVYFKKIKEIKDVKKKIDANDGEIKEIVSTYFQDMTLEEARKVETREKAKADIKKQINDLLKTSEKMKIEGDIVYAVNFIEWFYQ